MTTGYVLLDFRLSSIPSLFDGGRKRNEEIIFNGNCFFSLFYC